MRAVPDQPPTPEFSRTEYFGFLRPNFGHKSCRVSTLLSLLPLNYLYPLCRMVRHQGEMLRLFQLFKLLLRPWGRQLDS